MTFVRFAILALIVCALCVPAVVGAPGRDLTTLYVHTGDSNWMDEVAAPSEDADGLLLDSTGEIGASPTGLTFPLTPALDQDLAFTDQPLTATISIGAAFLGGAAPTTPPGPVTVKLTVQAGSATLATGTATGTMPDGVVSDTSTFTFSMSPAAKVVAAANNLVLVVDITTTAPSGPFFLNTAGDSFVKLPLAAGAATSGLSLATGAANVTAAAGSSAEFRLTVSGSAGTNYTLGAQGLPAGFTAAPVSGSLNGTVANVTLVVSVPASAAEGVHAFNATLSSGGSQVASIPLQLTVTKATASTSGTGSTSASSTGTSSGSGTSGSSSDGSSASDGSTSATDASDEEKDAPGLGPVVILVGLVALAFARRRRSA